MLIAFSPVSSAGSSAVRTAWLWPVGRSICFHRKLACAQITDVDILNFALNLEYLEAEFYNCAVTGAGLPSTLRGGGPASIGCQKANITGSVLVRGQPRPWNAA